MERINYITILLILSVLNVCALDEKVSFAPMNYGTGWYPWACSMEGVPADYCNFRNKGSISCPMEVSIGGYYDTGNDMDIFDDDAFVVRRAAYELGVRITIPDNSRVETSGGYVVGDVVCEGDELKFFSGTSRGEWWSDGGNMDSPAIYWVDDVEAVLRELLDYHKATVMTKSEVLSASRVSDGFVDPLTGIPVYNANIFTGTDSRLKTIYGDVTGALVCSLKPRGETVSDLENEGGFYRVSGSGDLTVHDLKDVYCMYYYYGGTGKASLSDREVKFAKFNVPAIIKLMDKYERSYTIEDFLKVGEIGVSKTLTVEKRATTPGIEVSFGGLDIELDHVNEIRVLVKNTGDADVEILDVYSNVESRLVSCDSGVLEPGETGECLFTLTPTADNGAQVKVRYSYTNCGIETVRTESKELIPAMELKPVLAEQSYYMEVYGCEDPNSFYACNPATENLHAGYKCYRSNGGYYTPANGRFNLKFDLSTLPQDIEILGAKLYLTARGVDVTQEVTVYGMADDSWETVECAPGGDICTRPYCGECENLYDVTAPVETSEAVTAPGRYGFDVTGHIIARYQVAKTASVQVRGVEDLWENEGAASCDKLKDWETQEMEFGVSGEDGVYLRVVYMPKGETP